MVHYAHQMQAFKNSETDTHMWETELDCKTEEVDFPCKALPSWTLDALVALKAVPTYTALGYQQANACRNFRNQERAWEIHSRSTKDV